VQSRGQVSQVGCWLASSALCLSILLSACDSSGGGAHDILLAALLEAEDARGSGPTGLTPLYSALESTDSELQAMAARGLGRMEAPDRVSLISSLMSSSDPNVRAEAVNALGQAVFNSAGDSVAGILLRQLAEEGDPMVRGVVGRTLGRLRYDDSALMDEAEEALVALTFDGQDHAPLAALTGAVMGLEWLARRNRGRELSEGTQDRLQDLSAYDATAESQGNPESVARVRRVALMALTTSVGAREGTFQQALVDSDPGVRRIALAALAGSPLGPFLSREIEAALADSVTRVRTQAVAAFAATVDGESKCDGLLETTQDPFTQVAIAALDLLARPCPETDRQIAVLEGFLREDAAGSPDGWHRGAHALLALAGVAPTSASEFLPGFSEHVSPFARAYAARTAARTEDLNILERLARDEDANVRTAAIEGLFRLQGHDADLVLLASLGQDDPQLTLTAAGLLEGTPKPSEAVPALLDALTRSSVERWETARDPRMGILERLGEVAGPETAEALGVYLSDYDPLVAETVAELLTEWTGKPAEATPESATRLPMPTPRELDEMARSRVILEMEGGGEIEIGLFPYLAPTNAARFARLARSGYFDGLTFHRVVSNFVLQGGSPKANEMSGDGPYTRDEIGLQSNWRGTVGTSTRGRDTGDGQLFINLVDNLRLDHNYTIFGEVVDGMDVVDRVVEGQRILRARVEVH